MSPFVDLLQLQIAKWLLAPQVHLVILLILMVSRFRPVERMDRDYLRETASDYFFAVLMTCLYAPPILFGLDLLVSWLQGVAPWMTLKAIATWPDPLRLLTVFVLADFFDYWSHRLRHRIPLFWRFHSVHHSQRHLNPLTTKRVHPFDFLIDNCLVKWIPLVVTGASLEIWTIFYLVNAVWDYVIHANLRIQLGPFNGILVSPQYHRVHHGLASTCHDRNFSNRLPLWDWLFGTLHTGVNDFPETGLDHNAPSHRGLVRGHLSLLAEPFQSGANS